MILRHTHQLREYSAKKSRTFGNEALDGCGISFRTPTMATNDDVMTTTTYQGDPLQSCRLRSCIAHPFGPWEMTGARRLPCW